MFVNLSIVIITLNEAHNLLRCLHSLPAGAEVIVVDSGSTDGTLELARNFGARIFQRPFDSFSAQKNYGISLASHAWILSLDADEAMDLALCHAVIGLCKTPPQEAVWQGFRLRRCLVFLGKPLRFGKTTDAPTRLFPKHSHIFFIHDIHETLNLAPQGIKTIPTGYLRHYSYKDLTQYFEKFNLYTSKIAESHKKTNKPLWMFSLYCRPFWEFVSRYFLRLGFLDGYAGFTYALLSSLYAFTKYAKLKEMYKSP